MPHLQQRTALIAAARSLMGLGLNTGTAGNLSLRTEHGMLITPSAIRYEDITPEMIAMMPLTSDYGTWEGPKRPSSEWRFHLDIMRARPDIGAIVHTHAPYCTALAMARRNIPACHYMVTRFGGADVRCAPYALFGTAELSALAVEALEGRTACLLANHGLIATGATLDAAMGMAVELEMLAKQYCLALSIGGPVLLTAHEIAEAQQQFATAYLPNE
ncbi:MAG: class II aldolase [Acidocella sp. 35-58-6]|nr:MAG: class II aldolase [Acidocella sp. 20-58-15]OYY02227.1 MAG: class II aldolase [Acidocella sp. 35-58-6]